MKITAPVAKKKASIEHYHGCIRKDDYSWLRDQNWRAVIRDPDLLNDDIRVYLNAENKYLNHK